MKLNRPDMRLKLLVLGLLITIFSTSYAQDNSSGIFLKIKSNKKNSKGFGKIVQTQDRVKSKSVLVPENPIVPTKEFIGISEITNDQQTNQSYFLLSFSDAGTTILKELTKTPGVQIVLIMDNTVVGELKPGEIRNKSIQLTGPVNSYDVLWAHTSIKKMLDARK
jgi:preprotein translocase subunit SecD